MSVTVHLPPEVEESLSARAQVLGLSIETYLAKVAEQHSYSVPDTALAGEEWEQELDAVIADLPDTPLLTDDAMKRENWYPDRN